MNTRCLVACLAAAVAGESAAQTLPTGKRLNDNGMLVGTMTLVGSSAQEGIFSGNNVAKVDTVIGREFGLIQTTTYPAWGAWNGTDINSVSFDISEANRVVNWAKSNNKKMAIHLLAGSPTYFPSWLNGGNYTPVQLDTLLGRWIAFSMSSNGNAQKVDYWNVVNEAFMWNGSYWDSSSAANTSPWQRMGWEDDKSGLTGTSKVYAQHPVYIRRAFELARKHTTAKLELRDYGIEFRDNTLKSRAFYQLVKHLVNSGVPIDAVGLQGHFETDRTYNWSYLQKAVKQYRDLGLEVYITEVDYGDAAVDASATTAHRTAAFDTLQSQGYYQFAKAAAAGGANWICVWGVADNTNQYWRMGQSALLFDEKYAAKPSYYSFRQGVVDGLASTSVAAAPARGTAWNARLGKGELAIQGLSSGRFAVLDLAGREVARVAVENGVGAVPPLARGLYLVRSLDNPAVGGTLLQQIP